MKKINIFIGALFFANIATSGEVRDIYIDEYKVAPIFLQMGKTTVLRFSEKPKKVVIGSSGHFSLEYIENDIAIQSLGLTSTNLFAYTKDKTYGLSLFVQQKKHDDLVKIFWKLPKKELPEEKSLTARQRSKIKLTKYLYLEIDKVKQGKSLKVADLYFYTSIASFDLSRVKINLAHSKRKTKIVLGEEKNQMLRARVFIQSSKSYFPYLYLRLAKREFKVSIQRGKLLSIKNKD